ncbi:hypothetical protein I4U23_016825 [Adineta vaga]|nr:hypothetical protein I4U23_016825 [Adineta vaga]
MTSRLWSVFAIVTWLTYIIQPTSSENVALLISCTTQKVNLKYSMPLPSATSASVVSTTATDNGAWNPCQVAGIPTTVQYYLTMNLTQAVFTDFFSMSFPME